LFFFGQTLSPPVKPSNFPPCWHPASMSSMKRRSSLSQVPKRPFVFLSINFHVFFFFPCPRTLASSFPRVGPAWMGFLGILPLFCLGSKEREALFFPRQIQPPPRLRFFWCLGAGVCFFRSSPKPPSSSCGLSFFCLSPLFPSGPTRRGPRSLVPPLFFFLHTGN